MEEDLPEPGPGLGPGLPASGSGPGCPSGFEKRPSSGPRQQLSPPRPAAAAGRFNVFISSSRGSLDIVSVVIQFYLLHGETHYCLPPYCFRDGQYLGVDLLEELVSLLDLIHAALQVAMEPVPLGLQSTHRLVRFSLTCRDERFLSNGREKNYEMRRKSSQNTSYFFYIW